MLTYSFTDIGSDSLYIHLYKCMKNDITRGNLTAGTKLPAKRPFAENLGISIITVENAYAQLAAEGYIYSLPRKGYYVAAIQQNQNFTSFEAPSPSPRPSAAPEFFADFSSNQVCKEQFPFSVWAKIIRELLSECQTELLTNPPSGGVLFLRESIAGYLRAFRNIHVDPEQIIVGAGTEYLYGLITQFLGRDKCYGIENPGYQKISKIYESHQINFRPVSVEKDGINIRELEEQNIDVMHLSPSHHFPTGIVTPISKRYELLGWAAKSEDRYIIEDDYDSEFRLTGQPIPSLQSIDAMEKVIYMNTFTKSLASTIRISYMVLPRHLLELFYEKLSFYSCTIPNLDQYALGKFIADGYFENHINRMRTYYHKKRDYLLDKIRKSGLAGHASILEKDSGLHFLLRLDIPCSDRKFISDMKKRGIRISALSEYYIPPQEDPKHTFIINYSSLSEEQIEHAVKELEDYTKEFRLPGVSNRIGEASSLSDTAIPRPSRGKPLDDRCPSDARPCKHGGRPPGVSRKKQSHDC